MDNKINGAVPMNDADLENVVGGVNIRQSPRVRVTGTQAVSSAEDPSVNAPRLMCPYCGSPMTKSAGCTNPVCVNSTNMARA